MDSIYLFIAHIEEVNRRLWAVMREGLDGTGLLVLDATIESRAEAYIKPRRRVPVQLPTKTHALYQIVYPLSLAAFSFVFSNQDISDSWGSY